MTRRLPPLNNLRAFEAAARHLSFKKAAAELHVTPAAISHQVRTLEDFCGAALFQRLTRSLRLTEVGRAALPLLREGFDKLNEASALLRTKPTGILVVSVPPSFGARWLVPRLDRLRARHPEFDVRLDATDALANFGSDGVDVAVRYGRGVYRDLHVECLMSEAAFPVCSPKLLAEGPPLKRPDDLRHHTLLHVQWSIEDEAAPNWRMWLNAAGVEGVEVERGSRFSFESMAIEAAIEGQGVALVGGALVEADLRAGRLVRPFPPSVREDTVFCYYLVYPEWKAADPKVAAFRDWLCDEVAKQSSAVGGVAEVPQ